MVVQHDQVRSYTFKDLQARPGWYCTDHHLIDLLADSYYWAEPDSWAQIQANHQQLSDTQTTNITTNSPPPLLEPLEAGFHAELAVAGCRKRRRTASVKNREKIEKQRMTHIAVERNRRKQMNLYLAELRSLMPPSYALRGDQASIVAGAINFVKELEQHLLYLEAHHQDGHSNKKQRVENDVASSEGVESDDDQQPVSSDFFTIPTKYAAGDSCYSDDSWWMVGRQMGVANVEVRMVESHANVKVRSTKQPKQLLKLLAGLVAFRLTILHLHVTTNHQTVLYSFSIKVEDGCRLSSVHEIATAVYGLMGKIQKEAIFYEHYKHPPF